MLRDVLSLTWAVAALLPPVLGVSPYGSPPGLFSGLNSRYCPQECSSLGADPANWTQIHRMQDFQTCNGTMVFDLNVMNSIDNLDNSNPTMRICSTSGNQTFSPPAAVPQSNSTSISNAPPLLVPDHCGAKAVTTQVAVTVDTGALGSSSSPSDVATAAEQLALYLEGGATCGSTLMFSKSGDSVVGMFSGSDIEKHSAADLARAFAEEAEGGDAISLQVCGGSLPGSSTFGMFAAPLEQLVDALSAVKTWVTGECLNSTSIIKALADTGISILVPLLGNGTISGGPYPTNSTGAGNSNGTTLAKRSIQQRATCSYIQVVSGDGCPSLATKCGITAAQFTSYNPSIDCSDLQVRQPVCCSSGSLPNLAPQPSANGTCAIYTIQPNDDCYDIAYNHYITEDDISTFNNNKTWGWLGCSDLQVGQFICLSTGNPPMPAPVTGTECGPLVPGTAAPNGTPIADLNPCPLNACCDSWGFCLADTGAPGTHQPGENGCISNCGTDIVNNETPPAEFFNIAYFEGFNEQRPCLTVDPSQINATQFTHIHFAFGGISASYQPTIDANSTDPFNSFLNITGPKRILSLGGWAFSTDPDTYSYFRTGVQPANQQTFANNVVSFITSNGLDGVDFDWEYAGEPDIVGIPAGSPDDGPSFLAFLKLVRAAMPSGKSISVALPASFWYLRAFPVNDMQSIVDYFVYMTYDLHGQWDSGNANADPGCPTNGTCLRSHVNLTETTNALSMLTKAGVSSTKIMMGISNYGRSFRMTDSSCAGPECTYTGGYDESNAYPGVCTGTPGYLADAEIYDIISGGNDSWAVFESYYDYNSNSDILIYGNSSTTADWVAYEGPVTQASRMGFAAQLNMGGTVTWAVDLEQWYADPDAIADGWVDLDSLDITCDPSQMPASLDDLAAAEGQLEPPCWAFFALQLLEDELEQALDNYTDAANGYGDQFGYYVQWVGDNITPSLHSYMDFGAKGNDFFSCAWTAGTKSGTDSCMGMPHFWEEDESWTITYTLTNATGFWDAIETDLGIDQSWVEFAEYDEPYSCAEDDNDLVGGGNKPCRRITFKRYNFPQKGPNVTVANPQTIIQAALPNITALQYMMLGAMADMALGLYDNTTENAVQAASMPVFMLEDAVASMVNIKQIGAQVAADQKKNLILEILSIVLIVIPFVGEAASALFGGAAMIARIALLISEVGNAALSIESIVADPLSAPFVILGLLAGVAGSGGEIGGAAERTEEDLFADAAAARRAMTEDDLSKFSEDFQAKDATVQEIVQACKVR